MESDYPTELQTEEMPGGFSNDADCLVLMIVSCDNLGGGNTRHEYKLRVRP